MQRQVPTLNLRDYTSESKELRDKFIADLKDSLIEYGFIILEGHLVAQEQIDLAIKNLKVFHLPIQTKLKYAKPEYKKQRGYIPFARASCRLRSPGFKRILARRKRNTE